MDFEKFIDFLMARSTNQEPIQYENYGNVVTMYDGSGNVGGFITQVVYDEMGRLVVRGLTASSIIGCGHAISCSSEVSGVCMICGRLCCTRLGCMETCDILGITCCKKHYSIIDGIVVSTRAQKGMWKSKAKKLARKRGTLSNDFKRLPEKV